LTEEPAEATPCGPRLLTEASDDLAEVLDGDGIEPPTGDDPPEDPLRQH